MLDLAVAHQEALLSALADASDAAEARRSPARPVTSSSRACPRSRWSSAGSRRPGRPPCSNGARPSCRGSCRPSSRTPRSPSTPPTRSRRCCGSWPSRRASSSAPTAAWPRWRWRAGPGPPKAPPTRRTTGAGRRSSGGSTCSRSTGSSARAAARRGSPASSSLACRPSAPRTAIGRFEGWLAASLTALDGSELGAIQLFDKQGGGFTVDDEAALVHLAQMTSAAVERARLYHERS